MKCVDCCEREAEEGSTLCVYCDRDEWKASCIHSNKRFHQDAERNLRKIHALVSALYRKAMETDAKFRKVDES